MTLPDLLARVGEAEGPDREIDAIIHVTLCQPAPEPGDETRRYRMPARNMDYEAVEPGHYWYVARSGKSLHSAPTYTSSLDAVVALVERVLPGSFWRAQKQSPDYDIAPFWAVCGPHGKPKRQHTADGATPALALLAALIKAKIAQEGEE